MANTTFGPELYSGGELLHHQGHIKGTVGTRTYTELQSQDYAARGTYNTLFTALIFRVLATLSQLLRNIVKGLNPGVSVVRIVCSSG